MRHMTGAPGALASSASGAASGRRPVFRDVPSLNGPMPACRLSCPCLAGHNGDDSGWQ